MDFLAFIVFACTYFETWKMRIRLKIFHLFSHSVQSFIIVMKSNVKCFLYNIWFVEEYLIDIIKTRSFYFTYSDAKRDRNHARVLD